MVATQQEIEALFDLQAETLSVEFKSWLDLSTMHGKATLVKSAIALANHGGGTIVFGMREAPDKPISSQPRPDEITRYTSDAVNAAINRYADPQIHCDVVHVVHPITENEHAFVTVPGGHLTPVMSVRDHQGTIMSQRAYIRKPGPKSEEPFTSEEWRGLMHRCVQNGRDFMLDSFRAIWHGVTPSLAPQPVDRLKEFNEGARARWESLIGPLPKGDSARMMLGRYQFTFHLVGVKTADSLPELNRLLEKAHQIKHTGWTPFVHLSRQPIAPAAVDGMVEAWVGTPQDDYRSGRHVDFWRAHPDGRLFLVRAFDEDSREGVPPGKVFSLTTPIWRLGEALLFVARLAREWDDNPDIIFKAEYFGLKGRALRVLEGDRVALSYDRVSQTDKVVLQGQATANEMLNNTEEVLKTAMAPLYEAFDFFVIPFEIIVQEIAKLKAGRF